MRTKWFWVAVVLLMTLSLALVTTALAVTSDIYVRTDGNDTECDGTADVAYPGGTGPLACAVQTIQQGIDLVGPGGTVFVRTGTYVLSSVVNVNKADVTLDGDGAGATIVQVSGTGDRFNITASGVTLQDFEIVKTDKSGLQDIIRIANGNNVTIKNNTIHGQFVIGDGDVSRAVVVNAGSFSGLNIEGNTIYGLRQPAYVSGTHTGTVQNNYVYGTKGWVLEGGNLTFTGNTWGTGAQVNVYDIAILSTMPGVYYTDIVAMSNANNGAVIEDQRVSPAVLSVVYVDASTAYASDLGGRYHPYSSITPAITRAVAGGTIHVAAGTYTENLTLGKSVALKGAQAGVTVSGRTAGNANEATVQGLITVNASDVEINGFTLTNPGQTNTVVINNNTPSHSNIGLRYNFIDTVGSVSLTSNVHAVMVYRGADNVTIEKNSFNNIKADNKSVSAVGVLDSVSTDASTGLLIQNNAFADIASATKGAYGVIINNAAGAPGAQIKDNSFSGLSGGWTHAIGLEGPTLDAVVTGNSFTNLSSAGIDKAAIFFEKNPNGATVTLQCNQFNGSTFYGVAIHPNDQPGGVNGYNYTVNAEENWWNAASGPGPVGPGSGAGVTQNVDYSPWYVDDTCTTTASEDPNGGITVPGGTDPALIQDILDDAPPGSEITFEDGGSYDGGLVVDTPGLTLNLNGATGGAGSPFLTVNGANITLNGPGTLDGAGDPTPPSPAIRINAGGDNFILNGVEIKNWADGVEVVASVNSLKIVNNWFHDNADAGVRVNSGVTIGGVITIEGNLFKFNGGNGIQNDGAPAPLPAEYNSWGDIGGSASGDGVGGTGGVDASPFSFAEVWMDVDPNASATQRNVIENDTFDVAMKVDAAGLYGVQYLVTYDPNLLTLNTTTDGAFVGTGSCTYNTGTPGVVSAYCARQSPDADANGTITVSTLNFTADLPGILPGDDGPWTNLFDISTAAADLSASAQGSIKAWVNNGGFGAPSANTGRTITDANDGQIDIDGLANYTGYVDVQGRVNDGGATLTVYDQLAKLGSTALAQAASVSSGAYTTAYLGPNQLVVGNTYYLVFDRALYLPTTAVAAVNYDDSTLLSDRPTTVLGILVLLGGDANDDNEIDIADAGCIGFDYGTNVSTCATGSSDVNGDGTINLLDLTLMGGNYGKTSSPWTP